MERDEIERYLLAAAGHSIVVDARQDPRLPDLVRKVTIHNGYLNPSSVSVDWEVGSRGLRVAFGLNRHPFHGQRGFSTSFSTGPQ